MCENASDVSERSNFGLSVCLVVFHYEKETQNTIISYMRRVYIDRELGPVNFGGGVVWGWLIGGWLDVV